MKFHIAVDIGGTFVRAASYPDSHLKPTRQIRVATHLPGKAPLQRIFELVSSVWPEGEEVAGIGVAAPGPVDPYRGIVLRAPNIPGWENLRLQEAMETRFNVPTAIGNDANLAALGEWKFGAGKGHHHLLYLTISTGIGGGVILNDQLLEGAQGLAAELGHITVLPDGPLCGCGQRGHLEAISSGPAIVRWVGEQIEHGVQTCLADKPELTAKDIAEAAKQGDALAVAALERAGRFIGHALAEFLHIFNPSIVVLGGGVSRSGPILIEAIQKAMQERILSPQYLDNLILTTAAWGDDAGLMGALAYTREKHK